MKVFTHAYIERLMHYFHVLTLLLKTRNKDTAYVASSEIANGLHLDASQIRRDLERIGLRGFPRSGFPIQEAIDAIRQAMGLNREWKAIIVGVGRLGSALASYGGFSAYGVAVVGLFDCAPQKIGATIHKRKIQSIEHIADFLKTTSVDMGIIAVPDTNAQKVADLLARGGVQAIWNFATVPLDVPKGTIVRHEHISVGLGELTYLLSHLPGRST